MNNDRLNQQNPSLILAVDNDEEQLLLISYALMAFDCTFITASDARTALAIAFEQPVDLILLDMVMPEVSGLTLVRQLKRDRRTCNIPIVAVTALVRKEEQLYLLLSGCDACLNKPYLLDELKVVVERYLSRERGGKTYFSSMFPRLFRLPFLSQSAKSKS